MRSKHPSLSLARTGGVVGLGMALLGGCAAAGPAGSFWHPPTPPTSGPPAFDGPYAEEFAQTWAESASDLERDILGDEVITESERGELHTWAAGCRARREITLGDTRHCWPAALDLDFQVRVNPDRLDMDVLVVECLVRHGLVDPGFTVEDHDRLWEEYGESEQLDALLPLPQYDTCTQDPLELLDGEIPYQR